MKYNFLRTYEIIIDVGEPTVRYISNFYLEKEEPTFRRDRKRWDLADLNKDDKISKDEFTAFLHPHQFDHMKDLVVAENLFEIDTNKDGYVSPSEFIGT